MTIKSVKGFRDVLPGESERRRQMLDAAIGVMRNYGYSEIELPLLERGELFSRSVGPTSDIVEKEMYAFEDRDGTLVALRPESAECRASVHIGSRRHANMSLVFVFDPSGEPPATEVDLERWERDNFAALKSPWQPPADVGHSGGAD